MNLAPKKKWDEWDRRVAAGIQRRSSAKLKETIAQCVTHMDNCNCRHPHDPGPCDCPVFSALVALDELKKRSLPSYKHSGSAR